MKLTAIFVGLVSEEVFPVLALETISILPRN
jgi:hypothetical protein